MWKVFINPETKEIEVFAEDGVEIPGAVSVTIGQDWGPGSAGRKGLVTLSFNGLAELVSERPKPKAEEIIEKLKEIIVTDNGVTLRTKCHFTTL